MTLSEGRASFWGEAVAVETAAAAETAETVAVIDYLKICMDTYISKIRPKSKVIKITSFAFRVWGKCCKQISLS